MSSSAGIWADVRIYPSRSWLVKWGEFRGYPQQQHAKPGVQVPPALATSVELHTQRVELNLAKYANAW